MSRATSDRGKQRECGETAPLPYPQGEPDPPRTLTQAGEAAGRSKTTYLGATYQRIAARRGKKRAALAIGRSILEIAYFVLRDGVAYKELRVNYYDEYKKAAVIRNALKRLERLGYRVPAGPAAQTPPPLGRPTFLGEVYSPAPGLRRLVALPGPAGRRYRWGRYFGSRRTRRSDVREIGVRRGKPAPGGGGASLGNWASEPDGWESHAVKA